MKLDHSSSGLVIVGGWNAHIFNPNWIKRYLFPADDEKFEIEMSISQSFTPQLVFPSILSKDVRILFQPNKLNILPVKSEDKSFTRIEDLALQLVHYLPHTPVSGYGVNFTFTDIDINEELIDFIRPKDLEKIADSGTKPIHEEYTRRFSLNSRIVNFTVGIRNEKITFKFNFHFDIEDLISFKAKINETGILKLKEEAEKFIGTIYGLKAERETYA